MTIFLTTMSSCLVVPHLTSQLKAQYARRASKTKLKRESGLLLNHLPPSSSSTTAVSTASEKNLQILRRLWDTYIVRVMADCKNEAQLQAR